MPNFKIPQNIEVEDRLFGPLTFKQFIYLLGGAGSIFVVYQLLPGFIAYLLIIPIGALSLALAFYKVNGQPFVIILEAFLRYQIGSKLYIWKRKEAKASKTKSEEEDVDTKELEKLAIPSLGESKLKDLAWSLDINENVN